MRRGFLTERDLDVILERVPSLVNGLVSEDLYLLYEYEGIKWSIMIPRIILAVLKAPGALDLLFRGWKAEYYQNPEEVELTESEYREILRGLISDVIGRIEMRAPIESLSLTLEFEPGTFRRNGNLFNEGKTTSSWPSIIGLLEDWIVSIDDLTPEPEEMSEEEIEEEIIPWGPKGRGTDPAHVILLGPLRFAPWLYSLFKEAREGRGPTLIGIRYPFINEEVLI